MASRRLPMAASKTSGILWGTMFEDSTLGIARVDLEGRFVEANRAYCRLVGYSNEELRALTLLDLATKDDCQANTEFIEQLRRGDRHDFKVEARYRRKDGQIIWVQNTVFLIPGSDESSTFIMTIAEDITARRIAGDNLRKQNEALQKIFDHVPVLISFTNNDGSLELVSRAWERVLGWPLEEIRKENLDIFSL